MSGGGRKAAGPGNVGVGEAESRCTGECAKDLALSLSRPCCIVAIAGMHDDPSGALEVARRTNDGAYYEALRMMEDGSKVVPAIVGGWAMMARRRARQTTKRGRKGA